MLYLPFISQVHAQTSDDAVGELVGELEVPKGVSDYNSAANGIGVILFLSNMIRFFLILGGIWVVINVVLAAFAYITGGGKADTHTKVKDRLSMSVIGLLLMIGAYTIAAIIGLVFYGDASYILSPTITQL